MIPKSISNMMMYSTIRIECENSVGTGFFFSFKINDKNYPVIITNKHVICNNMHATVKFLLHLMDNNEEDCGNYLLSMSSEWIFHPKYDICFTFAQPIITEIEKRTQKKVKITTISDDLIPNNELLESLNAIEEVVMVGYPTGLYDIVHNFPLFRHGYTSTHPAYDYNNEGIGVVDIAAYPGSSGSPVLILNEGAYNSKNGIILGNRVIFLGVMARVPLIELSGEIILKEIPTSTESIVNTPSMINLGYYIRAENILDFKKMIVDTFQIKTNEF